MLDLQPTRGLLDDIERGNRIGLDFQHQLITEGHNLGSELVLPQLDQEGLQIVVGLYPWEPGEIRLEQAPARNGSPRVRVVKAGAEISEDLLVLCLIT
jgi:hypothetical protein